MFSNIVLISMLPMYLSMNAYQQTINHYDYAYTVYLIVYLLRKTLKSQQKSVNECLIIKKRKNINKKKNFFGQFARCFSNSISTKQKYFPSRNTCNYTSFSHLVEYVLLSINFFLFYGFLFQKNLKNNEKKQRF